MEESFSVVSPDQKWILWGFLVGWAAVSIVLENKFAWASKISGAIIALLGALILSNFHIIPLESPVYDAVWDYVVPLAIPLLLFNSNIVKIWKESGRLLIIFLISSIGTVAGTVVAFSIFKEIIPNIHLVATMISASYTGGGVNFAAMASRFEVPGEIVSSTVVADNILMAVYILLLMSLPAIKLIRNHFSTPYVDEVEAQKDDSESQAASYWKPKEISLNDIAMAIGTTFAIVAVSFTLSDFFAEIIPENQNIFLTILRGIIGDNYLMLTTLTLLLVTIFPKYFENISGSQEIGTFLIYIFFVVIGVPASIVLIIQTAPLILIFAAIIILINMIISFTLGKLFKFHLEEIILTSNANIGGPTTAAAMAISKGWVKLVGPILIVGTLGYIIGNYIGVLVNTWITSFM
jgi:uncharacterized membrane protein